MTTLSESATAIQAALADLTTLTAADLVKFWAAYGQRPEFPLLLTAAFPELIAPYLQSSAALTATWYDELAPGLDFKAVESADIPADRMTRSVEWALFAPSKTATSLDRLAGSAQRMVMDASRQTVLTNLDRELGTARSPAEKQTRYARHASANACKFCMMLASRGAVYRSRGVTYDEDAGVHRTVVAGRGASLSVADRRAIAAGTETVDNALERRERYVSAGRAAKQGKKVGDLRTGRLRGNQSHGDRYHDHCHCIAVPVRPGTSYEPPSYVHDWDA